MRTHIVVPDDLVDEVDRLVGKRQRSAFFTEAARERLRRENLLRALRETAGSISADDHPEWATSRKVAAWVRNLRRDAIHQLKDALKKHEVSENDERRAQDEVQKMTDRHVADIDKLLQEKEKELMAV